MKTTVSTAKELGEAIKRKDSEIIIKGDLGDKVISIHAIGPVAWGVAAGAIGVAIAGIVTTAGTGGAGAPIGVAMESVAAPALVATMGGIGVSTAAIAIAVAGGGVGALTTMRKYKVEKKWGKVRLTRR